MRIQFVLAFICLTSHLLAQVPGSAVDQVELWLDVHPHPDQRAVQAHAKWVVEINRPVDSIVLNAVNFSPQRATLNGAAVEVHATSELWVVRPNQTLKPGQYTLDFWYRASPRKGLYFVGYDDASGRAPKQFWTQGQGVDHRHWVPYVDDQRDKLITHISCTVPNGWLVLSNGAKEVIPKGDSTVFSYHMMHPHPGYLMALAGGQYVTHSVAVHDSLLSVQWGYPNHQEAMEATYQYNPDMMRWMHGKIGLPFPWGKQYAQAPVHDFRHGAMENTCATLFMDQYFTGSGGQLDMPYLPVDAHEFAHQWFGNSVTATSSEHHWLHEGWATYWQWLAGEQFLGADFGLNTYAESYQTLMELKDSVPIQSAVAGTERFYTKGGWMLRQLEQRMGTEAFAEGYRNYLRQYAGLVVETHHLQVAMQQATDYPLDRFFKEHIQSDWKPRVRIRVKEKTLELERLNGYTDLLVEVVAYKGKKEFRRSIGLTQRITQVNLPFEPEGLVVDPSGLELVQVVGEEELARKTILKLPYANERLITLLRYSGSQEQWVKLLDDSSGPVRAEALLKLIASESLEVTGAKKMAKDPWVGTRKNLCYWSQLPLSELSLVENLLNDPSPKVAYLAFQRLVMINTAGFVAYESAVLAREDKYYALQPFRWYVRQLLGAPNAADSLAELVSPAFDYLVRTEAAQFFVELKMYHEQAVRYMLEGSFNPNSRLASTMRNSLIALAQEPDIADAIAQQVEKMRATFGPAQVATIKGWIKKQ